MQYTRHTRTLKEARASLAVRYEQQCEQFPTMRQDIDKQGYIKVNEKAARVYYTKGA